MRAFEDLIKEIEYENEKFVPIYEIVYLCFNFNEEAVKNNHKMWINDYYDNCLWYCFEQPFDGRIIQRMIKITKDFSIYKYTKIGDIEETYQGVSNQLEIFRKLKKWDFIEL